MSGSECASCCYRESNPCPRADYDPGGGCAGFVKSCSFADVRRIVYTPDGDKYEVTNIPVNSGIDLAQPGADLFERSE